MRLKNLFFKQKTPGFGISSSFYISVLCSSAVLPSLRDLVQPKPNPDYPDAVLGFGAPLTQDDAKPEALKEPLKRGAYALATPDRKTLLKMLVLGIDEAHFDPRAYADSSAAIGENPELLARMRGAWTVTQFNFESHDPGVFKSLLFLWQVAARLAELGEGVMADPLCERYRLPQDVYHEPDESFPIDVRDLVEIKRVALRDGLYAHTLGLQKLGLPEIEICRLEDQDEAASVLFLLGLVQTALRGAKLCPGHQVGSESTPFTVAVGGLDRSRWEGIACLELLPPSHLTASQTLRAWVTEQTG